MIAALIDEIRAVVACTLASSDFEALSTAVDRRGERATCDRLVATVTTANGGQAALLDLKTRLAADLQTPLDARFERWLVLREAAAALPRLAAQPLSDSVKRLFCEETRFVAAPPARARFDVRRASFVGLCELVTFRRFPAGQFHWSRSALPRSWLLKVRGRDRLRLLYWVARRMGGFGPAFVPHLNGYRKNRWLTEREANRSYYRMAESLRYQPEIRGLVASSWLRSPDTPRISPHLAWVNQTITQNGGLVVVMGTADRDSGVLARNLERKRLCEQGTFVPTTGLTLWPREAMLAWAARHPELAD